MTPIVLIPARLASLRLPQKPLADIAGKAMIVHVCERASKARIGPVIVAAADKSIVECVEDAGFSAVLTDPDLPSGSDRIHAALLQVDPVGRHDIIVNLQGDMPTLPSSALKAVLAPLQADPGCDIATLVARIRHETEFVDPNVVKAVLAGSVEGQAHARALYFSRAQVPAGDGPHFHHVGVYAYRRAALETFVAAPASGLERQEKLEQLRALELGLRIDCACLEGDAPVGVDTDADLAAARAHFMKA